jgi:hypothetical protein
MGATPCLGVRAVSRPAPVTGKVTSGTGWVRDLAPRLRWNRDVRRRLVLAVLLVDLVGTRTGDYPYPLGDQFSSFEVVVRRR